MDSLNKFFVYGTLRPGEQRWDWLKPYVETVEPAVLYNARLYTTGPWPFVVEYDGGEVIGEVVTVKDAAFVTKMLDAVEGYDPRSTYNLFNRVVWPVFPEGYPLTDGYVHANIYIGGDSLKDRLDHFRNIPSGDWKKRNA